MTFWPTMITGRSTSCRKFCEIQAINVITLETTSHAGNQERSPGLSATRMAGSDISDSRAKT